jgi:hypothetical protein
LLLEERLSRFWRLNLGVLSFLAKRNSDWWIASNYAKRLQRASGMREFESAMVSFSLCQRLLLSLHVTLSLFLGLNLAKRDLV